MGDVATGAGGMVVPGRGLLERGGGTVGGSICPCTADLTHDGCESAARGAGVGRDGICWSGVGGAGGVRRVGANCQDGADLLVG